MLRFTSSMILNELNQLKTILADLHALFLEPP